MFELTYLNTPVILHIYRSACDTTNLNSDVPLLLKCLVVSRQVKQNENVM